MAIYQFKLTPVDQFFFGGEKHDAKGESVNYFVESNPYPQQTTMLGLVRYFLLLKHNLIGSDKIKTEGEDLIGLSSFDFDANKQSFGKIDSLSALYFMKNDGHFYPAPFDFGYDICIENANYFMQKQESVEKEDKYTAKDHFPSMKVVDQVGLFGPSVIGNSDTDCIIFPSQHTGNEKGEKGESKEDAFYKQVYMKMKPGWSFAFDVSLNEELEDEDLYINFGGEKSLFLLSIKNTSEIAAHEPILPYKRNDLFGFYCLSDCFAEPQILEKTCFAITNYVSFRNFQSSVKTKNYAVYNKKDPDGMIRGSRFNLLGRGSVLYFKTTEDRDSAIKFLDKPNCKNIGFNNILKIN